MLISTNMLTRGEYRVHTIKVAILFCQYEAPLAAKSGFSPSQHSHSPPITLSLPPLPHSSSYYPSRSFAQLQQPAQKLSQRIMCYAKKILI